MRRYLLLSALLPCGLLAQTITQLSPLEYRPRPDRSRPATGTRPASFDRAVSAPATFRLGTLRQSEIDAVERDPMLTMRGVERTIERRAAQQGTWSTLDDGTNVWRLAIQSD